MQPLIASNPTYGFGEDSSTQPAPRPNNRLLKFTSCTRDEDYAHTDKAV